jgi:hypothetical protein
MVLLFLRKKRSNCLALWSKDWLKSECNIRLFRFALPKIWGNQGKTTAFHITCHLLRDFVGLPHRSYKATIRERKTCPETCQV